MNIVTITHVDDNEVAEIYLSGQGAPQIARHFGVSIPCVYRALRRVGVESRINTMANRTKSINDHAFDIFSREARYWAGFLMADGCISSSTKVGLTLQARDKAHLVKFQEFVGSNHKLSFHKKTNSYGLVISSGEIVIRLSSCGVVRYKTKRTQVIGLELDPDFWRGVVDGDGHISKRDSGSPILQFAGSKILVEQFLKYVKSLHPDCNTKARTLRSIWVLDLAGRAAQAALRDMYENAPVSLDRKQAIANEAILYSHKVNQYK